MSALPPDWTETLAPQLASAGYRQLLAYVEEERRTQAIYPPADQVFAAFWATSFSRTRVVLLGQDPYHGEGQAHGLCFSVPQGVEIPPSLANMFKELRTDLGVENGLHGDLTAWARQGILLLNTVLTVRAGEANSHRKKGWEAFTDQVIRTLGARSQPVIFALFGNPAKKKRALLGAHHPVIERAHPSPLSAHRGFLGTRPFSAIDEALRAIDQPPIDWSLPA